MDFLIFGYTFKYFAKLNLHPDDIAQNIIDRAISAAREANVTIYALSVVPQRSEPSSQPIHSYSV